MTANIACIISFCFKVNAGHCLYRIILGNFISKNNFHFLAQKKECRPFISKRFKNAKRDGNNLSKFCEQKEEEKNGDEKMLRCKKKKGKHLP